MNERLLYAFLLSFSSHLLLSFICFASEYSNVYAYVYTCISYVCCNRMNCSAVQCSRMDYSWNFWLWFQHQIWLQFKQQIWLYPLIIFVGLGIQQSTMGYVISWSTIQYLTWYMDLILGGWRHEPCVVQNSQ